MRELPIKATIRLWDTYLSEEGSSGFARFHLYVCAAFLKEWKAELLKRTGMNCIKIGLAGKSILRDYFQENMTSRKPFLLLKICFPGRPIFKQLVKRQLYKNRSSRKIYSQRLFS